MECDRCDRPIKPGTEVNTYDDEYDYYWHPDCVPEEEAAD